MQITHREIEKKQKKIEIERHEERKSEFSEGEVIYLIAVILFNKLILCKSLT